MQYCYTVNLTFMMLCVPNVLEKHSNSHDSSGQSNLTITDFQDISEPLQPARHLTRFFVYGGIKGLGNRKGLLRIKW